MTGDITYIWTAEGWLYLAVVLDVFSRRIVGWSMNRRMTDDLVVAAFRNALVRRRPARDLSFTQTVDRSIAASGFGRWSREPAACKA